MVSDVSGSDDRIFARVSKTSQTSWRILSGERTFTVFMHIFQKTTFTRNDGYYVLRHIRLRSIAVPCG